MDRRRPNQSGRMMPGAWVEEQKKGREDRTVLVKKARLSDNSDRTFCFMGTCTPINNIPQDMYIGRFLKGKHRIQDYRLEVTFCQLRA
jgi:hypothetical protein